MPTRGRSHALQESLRIYPWPPSALIISKSGVQALPQEAETEAVPGHS